MPSIVLVCKLIYIFLAGPLLCDGINDLSDDSRVELGVQWATPSAIYQYSIMS